MIRKELEVASTGARRNPVPWRPVWRWDTPTSDAVRGVWMRMYVVGPVVQLATVTRSFIGPSL